MLKFLKPTAKNQFQRRTPTYYYYSDDHGGHDGHGGAVPAERATRRSRVTARHGGHGGHGVSRRPSGWATPSAGCPAEAGQRRTTISHRAGGRAKSRSDERVSVTSTGDERHEEPYHVRKERSEEARNGWASGEVPAVTGRF